MEFCEGAAPVPEAQAGELVLCGELSVAPDAETGARAVTMTFGTGSQTVQASGTLYVGEAP